jgi:hypothetical protein
LNRTQTVWIHTLRLHGDSITSYSLGPEVGALSSS